MHRQTKNTSPNVSSEGNPPVRRFSFGKLVAVVIFAYLTFSFGVGVGKGTISFGSSNIFSNSVSKGLPEDLDYTSVEQLYDTLRQRFDGQLSEQELMDGLKQGLANATGDPYTEFMNVEEAAEFDGDLNGTFSGIGAELAKDEKSVVIVAPISGFPAEKAGLRAQDIIAEIDGESAYDISVNDAVKKIRGEAGTTVKLTIIRDKSQQLEFEITRATITIPSVESEILANDIGYLKISRFSDDTTSLAREAANEFRSKNVKGVILDLRSNPGGLLDSAVDLSNIWLPEGKTILQEKRDDVVIKSYKSKGQPLLSGIKTVVLIDEGSASASEITAGALHDHGVATLIGMKSFGKGSVQSLERLPGGGVLKVTIARWFTPEGKNIDKEGITPDKEVEISEDDLKAKRDTQKDAALEFLGR